MEYKGIQYGETGYPLRKAYNRAGFAYLTFTLGYLGGAVLLSVVAMLLYPAFLLDGYATALNALAMYLVGYPLFRVVFLLAPAYPPPRREQPRKLSVRQVLALFAVSYAIVLALAYFSDAVNNAIGRLVNNGYSADTLLDLSGENAAVLFVYGVIIAPVMEEIVFRGVPYKRLGGYGERAYVVGTAIVFGLIHMNLGQFFYAAALGLLFAKLTWETGTIRYSIILHVLVNLTGGVGIGGLILRCLGEQASDYYGYAVLALCVVGAGIAAWWCVRNRGGLRDMLPPPLTSRGELRRALLTPGFIAYYVVCALMIVSTILLPSML